MILHTRTPDRLLGGYHLAAKTPNDLGIYHGGEQWAPADFQIHRHSHPVWEFYYQLTGTTQWEVEGNTFKVPGDSLFGVSPKSKHTLCESSSSHRFLFLAIDFRGYSEAFKPLAEHLRTKNHLLLNDAFRAKDPMLQVLRELTGNDAYREQGLSVECNRFFLALQRLVIGSGEGRKQPLHPVVTKARQIIRSELATNWSLPELSKACGVSPGHLTHLFKQQVFRTVHDYILETRLNEAARMLEETDLPVGEIALELGFTSSQHFSTTFKKRRGHPPTTLRK